MPGGICCLYTNMYVVASEEIVHDTCVPRVIVINTKFDQIESKVSLILVHVSHCLRLFLVVYKVEM